MGPVEAAPEYRVIVDANNLTVEIENELSEWWEGGGDPSPACFLPSLWPKGKSSHVPGPLCLPFLGKNIPD